MVCVQPEDSYLLYRTADGRDRIYVVVLMPLQPLATLPCIDDGLGFF